MKRYEELLIKRNELVDELRCYLNSSHSRAERKATAPLRRILDSGDIKSQNLRESIGVLRFSGCSYNLIDMVEELHAQQVLLEDQYIVDIKSEFILKNINELKKLPGHSMRLLEFEEALTTVALASNSPQDYISTLHCSKDLSDRVIKILNSVMTLRNPYENVISYRQLTLDSMLA